MTAKGLWFSAKGCEVYHKQKVIYGISTIEKMGGILFPRAMF